MQTRIAAGPSSACFVPSPTNVTKIRVMVAAMPQRLLSDGSTLSSLPQADLYRIDLPQRHTCKRTWIAP